MNGFEERKSKKMRKIRESAWNMFDRYGFQKVSVKEIAKEAKVSQVTIYNYYGTKTKLIIDVLMHVFDQQLKEYEDVLRQQISFPEKVHAIMIGETKIIKMITKDLPEYNEYEEIKTFLTEYQHKKLAPFLKKTIQKGNEEGYINPDLSEEAIMFYFTMYQSELIRISEIDKNNILGKLAEEIIQMFFYGLSKSSNNN